MFFVDAEATLKLVRRLVRLIKTKQKDYPNAQQARLSNDKEGWIDQTSQMATILFVVLYAVSIQQRNIPKIH